MRSRSSSIFQEDATEIRSAPNRTLGDLAITRFGKSPIERAECERQALPALSRQRIRPPVRRRFAKHAPESERRRTACREVLIEGNDGCERRFLCRAGKHHGAQPTGPAAKQDIYAIICHLLVGRREPNEISGGAKPLRCGGEKNDGRIETREPEHFHPVGPLRRVDRETAVPTARRARPHRTSLVGWPCGIRAGKRDCDGGIPTPVRRDRGLLNIRRRRLTASPSVLASSSPCVTRHKPHATGA